MSAFLEILILLGALQGFIISTLLFFSKPVRQSSIILGFLIFIIALASLKLYVTGTNWYSRSPVLIFLLNIIPMIIIMPMGPLIYFYVRSYDDPSFSFNKKFSIHFFPVLIDLVPHLTVLLYIVGLTAKWFSKNDAAWGGFIDQYNIYSDIPRWLSVSIYLWAVNSYLKSQQKPIPWLRQFVKIFMTFQIIWLCYLVPYVIPKYTDRLMALVNWYPVYIPMSILIYWLGIKGYLASKSPDFVKNRKSLFGDKNQSEEIIAKLKKAMEEEKLWMDPALNLSVLTKRTGIPSKIISAVLNQQLNKNFNEFINEYRISAIKARLLTAENKNLTIAGLAYECGFNSQPTFQRAFKSIEGESPSEFLMKHADSVSERG